MAEDAIAQTMSSPSYYPIVGSYPSFEIQMTAKYDLAIDQIEELKRLSDTREMASFERRVEVRKWVYPEWVWWTPKPENEQYYRFLGIGFEKVEFQSLNTNVIIKEVRGRWEDGVRFVDITFTPISELHYNESGRI